MSSSREQGVTTAFVSIVDNLVGEFDLALLNGLTADCARLLDVEDASLLLADYAGARQAAAATSEAVRLLQLVQLDHREGPCVDCLARGGAIRAPDLGKRPTEWPIFAPAALSAGYASVHALPLSLQSRTLGALGLFRSAAGDLSPEDIQLARALAHAASVALAVHAAAADQELLNSQLQTALNSRVVLEQAKGVISAYGNLSINQSFDSLRRFARNHNQRLTTLAQAVVERTISLDHILEQDRRSAHQKAGRRARPGGTRTTLNHVP